jgi:single stranded DNA-binding protein
MNRQWTDSDQQVHQETDWMAIVIWKMENLAAYLIKGTKVYVEGRLQTRSYDDKDGVKRYVTEVVAQNIVLLGGNGNGQAEEGKPNTVGDLASPQVASEVTNRNLKIKVSKKTWMYLSKITNTAACVIAFAQLVSGSRHIRQARID